MENAGILLVGWLLIAPIVGVLILSGLGSDKVSRYTGTGSDTTGR